MQDLDPLEASVHQKEMFKKNLEEKRQEVQLEPESDEDSGYDVTSISTSGDVGPGRLLLTVFRCQGAGLWTISRRGWSRSTRRNWREGRELKNIWRNKPRLPPRRRNCSIFILNSRNNL